MSLNSSAFFEEDIACPVGVLVDSDPVFWPVKFSLVNCAGACHFREQHGG